MDESAEWRRRYDAEVEKAGRCSKKLTERFARHGMEGPIPATVSQLKNLTELRITDLKGMNMTFPNLQRHAIHVRIDIKELLNYWSYSRILGRHE